MEQSMYLAKPDETIEEHVGRLMDVLNTLKAYGYITDEHLIFLVEQACRHHDDGKANAEFQKRIKKGSKFNPEKEIPHNVLSGFFLDKNEFQNEDDYYAVLFAILYHHNYGDPYDIIRTKKDLIDGLLKDFSVFSIKRRTLNEVQRRIDDKEAILVKGYLHKCDYSASGHYLAEYPNNFLEDSMENVKTKWKAYDPNSDWNALQKFAIEKRNENVIMAAQTGMGKTEAGLQWIGNNKGYFVLPLRTAINAIYERVKNDILLNENLQERLAILHSESLEYYSRTMKDGELNLLDYERRGKHLSMPLNISTMDQLFDFVFKYQGYELKLVTLSYSKIVIDEIQMYDPELLAYLIYGLKKISELGGKIAVMTATLSPFVKELLMSEIPFKEENIALFTNDTKRHNVKTIDGDINAEDIISLYHKNESEDKSNKILVVCNTIKKAQELYTDVKEKLAETGNLHILHSRYTRTDRAQLENAIRKFGRTYDETGKLDKRSGIWFSTSLVEASLDIDFDCLVTELQDLNSLFQRMGRCNRKGIKDISEPNCFVYLKSSNAYIDQTIFSVSKEAMKTVNGVLSEKDKISLIDQYMTMEKLKDSEYYIGKNGYMMTKQWIEGIAPYKYVKDENRLRNILSIDIIPNAVYLRNQDEIRNEEQILLDKDTVLRDRIKAKDVIMGYSVSIPYWQWVKYQRAIFKNMAERYSPIRLSKYENIPVMECQYDDMGFRPLDYDNAVRKANIL